MKLVELELFGYSLPLTGSLSPGGATLDRREGIIVRLTGDDGTRGLGEASPLPGFSGESLQDAVEDLRCPGEILLGQEPGCGLELPDMSPSARFGIELALWNMGSMMGGGKVSPPRPANTVYLSGLLAGPEDEMLRDARRIANMGYRSAKLKVGRRSVEEDIELVRVVGGILGGSTSLRLDANRAWSLEQAGKFASATEGLNFDYVEEPLADPAQLPRFTEEWDVPVALDESLVGMEPEEVEAHGYARAVVLKPTLLGGISRTIRLAESARKLGIVSVMSSAYETGVGTLGLISLAASLNADVPAGLDTYRWLAEDVLAPPLELSGPSIEVRKMLGVRREVRWEALSRLE